MELLHCLSSLVSAFFRKFFGAVTLSENNADLSCTIFFYLQTEHTYSLTQFLNLACIIVVTSVHSRDNRTHEPRIFPEAANQRHGRTHRDRWFMWCSLIVRGTSHLFASRDALKSAWIEAPGSQGRRRVPVIGQAAYGCTTHDGELWRSTFIHVVDRRLGDLSVPLMIHWPDRPANAAPT